MLGFLCTRPSLRRSFVIRHWVELRHVGTHVELNKLEDPGLYRRLT